MKYLRKLITTFITVIFLSACVIGTGVALAVKNVNVSLETYSYAEGDLGAQIVISEYKDKILSKVRGNIIYGVEESDVASVVDGDFRLVKFEKIMPCTVNVTLRERRETFAQVDGDGYSVYDEGGILLEGGLTNVDPYDVVLDIMNAETPESVAKICSIFKSEFLSLRATVKKVECSDSTIASKPYKNRIVFSFHCGILLEIRDYNNRTEEKFAASYKKFSELSGEKKLKGTLICSLADGDVISVVYVS